ncbi:MAG: ATP-binding protein [Planctomycetaceae bacterium]
MSKRCRHWSAVLRKLGRRYENATVENFEFYGEPEEMGRQHAVVDAVQTYRQTIAAHVRAGRGIIFFGPSGTGKDHLAAALLREVCREGLTADAVYGMDLFGKMRDRMGGEESEGDLLLEVAQPDVLLLSDPLPPWGRLTDFQAQFMLRILHRRNAEMKATLVTVNVASRAELEDRLGTAAVDRLAQGALKLFCNWSSFRGREA